MLRRRGPIIGIAGLVIAGSTYLILLSLFPSLDHSPLGGAVPLLSDRATTTETIGPGESATFQYVPSGSRTLSDSVSSFMWGAHIPDYEPGDGASIVMSDSTGNVLDTVRLQGWEVFEPHVAEFLDTYYFEVTNIGDRPFSVFMTFLDSSDLESDSIQKIIHIGLAGVVFLVGVVVIIVGAVVTLVDWKSEKRTASY